MLATCCIRVHGTCGLNFAQATLQCRSLRRILVFKQSRAHCWQVMTSNFAVCSGERCFVVQRHLAVGVLHGDAAQPQWHQFCKRVTQQSTIAASTCTHVEQRGLRPGSGCGAAVTAGTWVTRAAQAADGGHRPNSKIGNSAAVAGHWWQQQGPAGAPSRPALRGDTVYCSGNTHGNACHCVGTS
eukprot:jgi/Ulvmu1/7471/UM037_0014.1